MVGVKILPAIRLLRKGAWLAPGQCFSTGSVRLNYSAISGYFENLQGAQLGPQLLLYHGLSAEPGGGGENR